MRWDILERLETPPETIDISLTETNLGKDIMYYLKYFLLYLQISHEYQIYFIEMSEIK